MASLNLPMPDYDEKTDLISSAERPSMLVVIDEKDDIKLGLCDIAHHAVSADVVNVDMKTSHFHTMGPNSLSREKDNNSPLSDAMMQADLPTSVFNVGSKKEK